jgi:Tfp pilus assembly protein PilF
MVVAIIGVLLVAIVWVVFGQTLRHEFVNYDDDQYVYENPRIANGLTLDGIGWAFTHAHASNWHPLTTISHMLDCQLYGLRPWGHHLTNVLLHAAAAVFLFLALRELTGTDWPSGFVAAVFAIHPLHVSSVAWVAERKDVLSGVFFMLTLWAYARYARGERSSRPAYVAALVSFGLGLMCKPTVITLPFVLLLLDYWPLRRFGGENDAKHGPLWGRVRDLLIEKIPFFFLAAGSGVATLLAQESAVMTMRQLSLGERIGNAMVSYVTYISQMFWPAGLALFYPYPPGHVNVGQAVSAFLLLTVISLSFLFWRRALPFLLVGWLWFLGMLVPMIGLIQVGEQARADRYTYLAQIGLYILSTWGALKLIGGWRRGRGALAVLAGIIVLGLTGASYAQTSFWRESETLWDQTLAHTTNNYIAHNNLAKALMLKGRLDEAVYHFRQALEFCTNCPEVDNNLGHVLARKGEWAEAATAYRAAVRDWGKPNAHNNNNLGISLARIGESNEAIEQFREALRIDPDYREAHSNLALLLLQLDRRAEAIAEFKEALRLKPDDAQTKAQLRQLGVEN